MNKFMPAQFRLKADTTPDTGEKQITIEVFNESDAPIEQVSVTWYYDYDDPFGKSARPLEGWIEFLGCWEGPLPPGTDRQFVFPQNEMPRLLSIVASLSSDRHFVLVKCDDETDRIDGRTFGGWVEKEFG
jgi:hypothetical protein